MQKDGIGALGDRIAVQGLIDCTKTAVIDIGMHPVMRIGQIGGVDDTGYHQQNKNADINRKRPTISVGIFTDCSCMALFGDKVF